MSKLNFDLNGQVYAVSEAGTHDPLDEDANPFRYELRDGVVVDAYPGVDDEDVMAEYNSKREAASIAKDKAALVETLKGKVKTSIESLAWKIERATERDAVNGTNTLADVYAEREAIRAAGNAAEAEILDADTTLEEAVALVKNI